MYFIPQQVHNVSMEHASYVWGTHTSPFSLQRLYSRSPESYQETTGAASTAVTTMAISLRRRHGSV